MSAITGAALRAGRADRGCFPPQAAQRPAGPLWRRGVRAAAACALDDAVQIVERPRVATPLVTCSVGLASWDFSEAAPELVERADRALYLAEAEGRNRFVTA